MSKETSGLLFFPDTYINLFASHQHASRACTKGCSSQSQFPQASIRDLLEFAFIGCLSFRHSL